MVRQVTQQASEGSLAYFTSSPIAVGAAYGTAKAGIGITGMGTQRPELIMKVSSAMQLAINGSKEIIADI